MQKEGRSNFAVAFFFLTKALKIMNFLWVISCGAAKPLLIYYHTWNDVIVCWPIVLSTA